MFKKIVGMALLLSLVTTTPVFAATTTGNQSKAAPALAVEILTDYGVQPTGKILSSVALEMGPNASFMGIEKSDPMYRHEVMHYLHCILKVIVVEDHNCMTH